MTCEQDGKANHLRPEPGAEKGPQGMDGKDFGNVRWR